MTDRLSIRSAQAAFFLITMTGVAGALAALGALTVEWMIVAAFLVLLFTIELGSPWYDDPWWRTKLGLIALVGFVLYVSVLLLRLIFLELA